MKKGQTTVSRGILQASSLRFTNAKKIMKLINLLSIAYVVKELWPFRFVFKLLLSVFSLCLLTFANFAENVESGFQDKELAHGVFRINTDISAGEKSLAEIIGRAKDCGLDFVVISDQFLVRCEYGVKPFRNIFKASRERKSVKSFGIEKYFELINEKERANQDIAVITGLDIAPYYYWDFDGGKLVCRQFSQQLTVFGEIDSEFASGLPVIHNYQFEKNPLRIASKLYPLLLFIPGILLLRRKLFYEDAQGNRYFLPLSRLKLLSSLAIFAIALTWAFDNQPFRKKEFFSPYEKKTYEPFQLAIDYVKRNGRNAGIVWSSPEAASSFEIEGVALITEKYPDVINNTFRYDGFAGIYGDARTSHLPGREWDKALLDYCRNKRENQPFVYGELDYHKDYDGIPFDFIKTVVFLDDNSEKKEREIISALLRGSSYAVSKGAAGEIQLEKFYVKSEDKIAWSGEKIFAGNSEELVLVIAGKIKSDKQSAKAKLDIIINGQIFDSTEISDEFQISQKLKSEELAELSYIRLIFSSELAGELLSNPIFIAR